MTCCYAPGRHRWRQWRWHPYSHSPGLGYTASYGAYYPKRYRPVKRWVSLNFGPSVMAVARHVVTCDADLFLTTFFAEPARRKTGTGACMQRTTSTHVGLNNRIWASKRRGGLYTSNPADVNMDASAIAAIGGGQPHNNMSPYGGLRCIIALTGVFPSRN